MSSSRRQYPFHLIEPKWQGVWDRQQTFRAWNPGEKIPADHPFAQRHGISGKVAATQFRGKFYILDMFPYPSGAGLHVGHPEGYTATDILARYKRAQGFNVLHPMGWDAFGLPAEQYAIKTGQHPRKTTEANIANFTRQIKSLGFSYDWSREIATTDPDYFKWTQWIFLKLYNSWFNPETNKAESIEAIKFPGDCKTEEQKRSYRDSKRLAYVCEAPVNWCPELGTVLANEEVIDGKSEVGGFPVVRRPMRQWMLRITAYAEKLLADLDTIDWSESLKEMQRNWIGRSEGAEVDFQIAEREVRSAESKIRVFTTRPDTLFGATYMVLAPEHKLVDQIIPPEWPAGTPDGWKGRQECPGTPMEAGGTALEGRGKMLDEGGGTPDERGSTPDKNGTKLDEPERSLEGGEAMLEGHESKLDERGRVLETPGGKLEEHGAALEERGRGLEMPGTKLETAVSPENAQKCRFSTPRSVVEAYRANAAGKSDLERTELAKEKTGVFTGAYAINPVNGEKIPIWIADYVLANYGTGAIMAVPAHDERDFEFAKNFKLQIKSVVGSLKPFPSLAINSTFGYDDIPKLKRDERTVVINGEDVFVFTSQTERFVGEGVAWNSANSEVSLNDLPTAEAKKKITAWLEEKGLGKKTINYKLRDWLFSRQRYWGEPFPIVWKKGPSGQPPYHEALPESALPVLPPTLEDYKPTPDGQPPLARAKDWLNLPDGSVRETNTMPQWAGSCWYYLRYLDAKNDAAFVGREPESYWMGTPTPNSQLPTSKSTPGVDLYVGGTEHAVLHLLYARFWHKVLFDLGFVSTPEPFFKLVNQGLILGEDGQKMSKARGNVVNPDDMVKEFGADSLRLYEMFMGPLQDVKPWNTKGVEGVYRFLGRVWRLFVDEKSETAFEQAETLTAENTKERKELLDLILLDGAITDVAATPAQLKTLHACIKKVTEDLDGMRFNTAISAMMVFVNEAMTWQNKPFAVMKTFLQLLAPFAPHLSEELWQRLHSTFGQVPPSLTYAPWPKFDPARLVESEIEIPVQVNGKFRDVIKVAVDADNATIEAAAKASEKVRQFIAGKTIKKVIIVPKKMVNLIAS